MSNQQLTFIFDYLLIVVKSVFRKQIAHVLMKTNITMMTNAIIKRDSFKLIYYFFFRYDNNMLTLSYRLYEIKLIYF